MATRITTEIIDDLTGEPGATTFFFAIGTQAYEIDLVSIAPIQEALAPFVKVARKATRTKPQLPLDVDNAEIRRWAAENGISVPGRGRIPDAVRHAFSNRDPKLAQDRIRA